MKSVSKPLLFAAFLLLPGLLMPPAAWADDDGRYRAVVLREGGITAGGGSLTPRVFLFDSRDGHMWVWEQNMPLLDAGKQSFGTLLTYQGKLKPGKEVGEIIYPDDNNR